MNSLLTVFFVGFLIIVIQFAIILLIFMKTPAVTWLKASFTKRRILIKWKEDRQVEFITAKLESGVASTRRGKTTDHYIINPKAVYTESRSKIPMANVYGNIALTIDPTMAAVADHLASLGIKDWKQLKSYVDANEAKGIKEEVIVMGEAIDLSEFVRYLNANLRSDLIEAIIQRRTAAEIANRNKDVKDVLKWAAFFMIMMMGAALAYAIIMQVTGSSGGAESGIISSIGDVVSNVKDTGSGVVVK